MYSLSPLKEKRNIASDPNCEGFVLIHLWVSDRPGTTWAPAAAPYRHVPSCSGLSIWSEEDATMVLAHQVWKSERRPLLPTKPGEIEKEANLYRDSFPWKSYSQSLKTSFCRVKMHSYSEKSYHWEEHAFTSLRYLSCLTTRSPFLLVFKIWTIAPVLQGRWKDSGQWT